MRRLLKLVAFAGLLFSSAVGNASLEDDGVWEGTTLWASTVFADGVWAEGSIAPGGGGAGSGANRMGVKGARIGL